MAGLQFNRDMIFLGNDLSRPRMVVEKEKMRQFFPGFDFYGTQSKITSVQGTISTSYGNSYDIKVIIGPRYPYTLPTVALLYKSLDSGPHQYNNGEICVLKSEQWSSTLSLACIVAKAAVWLNKYDSWRRNGKKYWPGKGQSH
jgi:ubiquitin-protein ligase